MADRQVKVAIVGDSKGLTGALTAANAELEGFGSKLASFGRVGALAFAALGIGAVAGLEQIGASFDSAFDKIRVSTGQTGQTLNGLQDSFKTVLSGVPASMDTVAAAISGVNQKLGLTGAPLEGLSKQFVNLSRITETDLGANLDAVTGLFNNFGVSAQDQGGKLDELFRASQQSGVSVADLATQMTDTGAVFRQAGFTFDQSASLLALLGKNGLSASDVLPSLSKALAGAAKEGKPANQVIGETFNKIKNAPNDTKAAGEALSVFGAKAGPKLAALIREGKLSYEEFAKAISSGDTINQAASDTDDWREKLDILKNKTLVALEPVASAVFDGFTRVAEWLIDTGLPRLGDAFNAVKDALTPLVSAVADWAASSAWPAIAAAFQSAFGWIVDTGVPAVVGAFNTVKQVIGSLVDDIIGGFQNPGAAINVAGWEGVALRIGQVIRDGVDIAIAAFNAIRSWVVDNWPAIQGVFNTVWASLQVGFQWLLDHKAALIAAIAAISVVLLGPFVTAVLGAVIAYQKLEGFRKVVDNIVSWVQDSLLPAFKGMTDWITENTGKLAAYISERWEAISAAVTNVLTVLKISVGAALAPIIFIWTNAHDQIMEVVNVVWGNIKLVIETAMRIIKDIIDVVLGLLSGDWGLAWDGIKDIPLAAFEYMKGVVQLGIDAIKAIIEGVLVLLAALWSLAWDGIKTVLAAAWEAIKAAVAAALAIVVQFFIDLPGRLLAALAALAGLLAGLVSAAVYGMAVAAEGAVHFVIDFFAGLPGRARDAMGELGGFLTGKGVELLQGFLSGITEKGGEAVSWVADLPSKVFNALSGVGSALYERGRQLVGGFIDGIKSRAGDVLAAIGSAIPGGIGSSGTKGDVTPVGPGHAAGALITSPEIAQLGEGGRDEAVINGDQAVRLLWAMANGKAPAGGAAAVLGASAPVYNINITAGLGTDPYQLSTVLVDALKRYDRGNGGVPIRATG